MHLRDWHQREVVSAPQWEGKLTEKSCAKERLFACCIVDDPPGSLAVSHFLAPFPPHIFAQVANASAKSQQLARNLPPLNIRSFITLCLAPV